MHLSDELARVLMKRIAAKIDKARYYPGEVRDPQIAAFEILKPYASKLFAAREHQLHEESRTEAEMKRTRWIRHGKRR